jgi:hypothetical protein
LIILPAAKFAVGHFLQAKNMSVVEIHHELCAVYSQNVMSDITANTAVGCTKMGEKMNKCSH